MRKGLVWRGALTFASILLSGSIAQAGPSGAIFTTVANGTVVNANQYNSKCDVYLDGGPGANAPAGAAGLPDGSYYFQVTDPNGQTLLSTDPVNQRMFQVTGGVITAYTGAANGGTHQTSIDLAHASAGAITISMANSSCPTDFLDSPNNGGVYKVWVTPTASYVGDPTQVDNPSCGNQCYHGFVHGATKTDNFKVNPGVPNFCLTVTKQIVTLDVNGNVMSSSITPTAGWTFTLTNGSTDQPQDTNSAGVTTFCALPAGTYTVSEAPTTMYPFFDAIFNLNLSSTTFTPTSNPTLATGQSSAGGCSWSTGSLVCSVSFTWVMGDDTSPSVVFQNCNSAGSAVACPAPPPAPVAPQPPPPPPV